MSEGRHRLETRTAVLLGGIRLIRNEFFDFSSSMEANRRALERDSRLVAGPTEKVFSCKDVQINSGLAARVYRPSDSSGLPVILYFHGGGWVVGSVSTHDNLCRKLANRARAVVVSVDYRLAPENKYPAAVEDAYSALQWVQTGAGAFGGDPARLAVAGDSAGGNLAAVSCLVTRDRGGPPVRFQALLYPGLDAANLDSESYRLNGSGYYLTKKAIERVIQLYINEAADLLDPYVSPLRAADVRGLPPGLVITAQFDPLCSEGEAYAARLSDAGIPCTLHRYEGMIHGFASFTGLLPHAAQAIGEMAAAITGALR